jgi:homocysteine S-methyltransferase
LLHAALVAGRIMLDGGLATELEAQGHDLSSALWSARLLTDNPEAIVAAHQAFFEAGAQVAITASYQAPLELIGASVRLARQSIDRHGPQDRWVAGSVGPYGASLADGSEYHGRYDVSVAELRAWHRPRIDRLAEAGADLLALETVPCLAEVEALLAELTGTGLPAWLSITCAGERTRAGEPAMEAFAMARGIDEVLAVGVNCTDPRDATGLIQTAAAASGKPVVVYPNSGERWDATDRSWVGEPAFRVEDVQQWVDDGARLIGGCCRVGPAQIAALAEQVRCAAPPHH